MPSQKPNERMNEAEEELRRSLERQHKAGQTEQEIAYANAEADGRPIVGDPAATAMHEIPREYQHSLPNLGIDELLSWGVAPASIVKQMQNGLLGDEYLRWSLSSLQEYVLMRERQGQRRAMSDAGKYASKTLIDPTMEPYWEGRGPHPKTGKWCTFISHIAQLTCPVGINGRVWYIEKGRRYDLPTEVIRILVEKSAALDELEKVAQVYQQMGQMPIMQKVAQQGGMTQAAQWAESYLAPVGGPSIALPTERVPGMI